MQHQIFLKNLPFLIWVKHMTKFHILYGFNKYQEVV